MTCNIRCSTMPDRKNSWAKRRMLCADTIKKYTPDIICLQECHWVQFEDLLEQLGKKRWGAFWIETEPDGGIPENAIFYDKQLFEVRNYGGFWLSETPHIPGSFSWGSECVRFVNYLVLRSGEIAFRIINTHLDHASQAARENQADLLVKEASVWNDEMPQIIAGDFNCDFNNAAMQKFFAAGWQDSFAEVTGIKDAKFTFHAFKGDAWNGDMGPCGNGKMDWILFRGPLVAADSFIIKDHIENIYPSDHYFVITDFKNKTKKRIGTGKTKTRMQNPKLQEAEMG